MERREVLRVLASAAALTALSPDKTLAAWSRVASGIPLPNELSPAHMALVRAIADTIIPRTDTPSATDVGVPKFVDVIVNEYLPEAERDARRFREGRSWCRAVANVLETQATGRARLLHQRARDERCAESQRHAG